MDQDQDYDLAAMLENRRKGIIAAADRLVVWKPQDLWKPAEQRKSTKRELALWLRARFAYGVIRDSFKRRNPGHAISTWSLRNRVSALLFGRELRGLWRDAVDYFIKAGWQPYKKKGKYKGCLYAARKSKDCWPVFRIGKYSNTRSCWLELFCPYCFCRNGWLHCCKARRRLSQADMFTSKYRFDRDRKEYEIITFRASVVVPGAVNKPFDPARLGRLQRTRQPLWRAAKDSGAVAGISRIYVDTDFKTSPAVMKVVMRWLLIVPKGWKKPRYFSRNVKGDLEVHTLTRDHLEHRFRELFDYPANFLLRPETLVSIVPYLPQQTGYLLAGKAGCKGVRLISTYGLFRGENLPDTQAGATPVEQLVG